MFALRFLTSGWWTEPSVRFLVMIRQLPRSTLSTSTTVFRAGPGLCGRPGRRGPHADPRAGGTRRPDVPPAADPPAARRTARRPDRKSTRLNSSPRQYLVCRLLLDKEKTPLAV